MQRRLHSLIESVSNVGSGFIIASLLWEFVVKSTWHIETGLKENLQITTLFTVVSILRGYVFRRIFNRIAITQLEKQRHDNATTLDRSHR